MVDVLYELFSSNPKPTSNQTSLYLGGNNWFLSGALSSRQSNPKARFGRDPLNARASYIENYIRQNEFNN